MSCGPGQDLGLVSLTFNLATWQRGKAARTVASPRPAPRQFFSSPVARPLFSSARPIRPPLIPVLRRASQHPQPRRRCCGDCEGAVSRPVLEPRLATSAVPPLDFPPARSPRLVSSSLQEGEAAIGSEVSY